MFHAENKPLGKILRKIQRKILKRRALAVGLFPLLAAALYLLALCAAWPAAPARAFTTNQSASVVVGQPDMTSAGPYQGGFIPDANTLNGPRGVFSDGTKLFVADSQSARVLIFNTIPTSNNANASVVVGQPDMTNENYGATANMFNDLGGIFSKGTKLFIVDTNNHRVLIYNTIPTSNNASADVVIGQPNMTSAGSNQGGGAAANTLNSPRAVYSDGTKLFIADTGNQRVLIYNTIPTSNNASADVVIGQPDMTSNAAGTTANRMWGPSSVSSDGTKLFIADLGNNRVLIYNTIPTSNNASADLVIGQPNMTSGSANQGGSAAANTFDNPVAVSSYGTKLFVSDQNNNRVLIFNTIPTSNNANADTVLGQPDMTSNSFIVGSYAANTLSRPQGIFSDGSKLFVTDFDMCRVLIYEDADTTAPTVTDNQAGDNTWRIADPGAIYDVDFSDTGGSNLNNVQYAVYSAAALGGSQLKNWTDIATGINAANYTANWSLDWASLQNGTNYVSVRAYDNAGNPSAVLQDVFYIKKDPAVPTVTDNQAGDNTWRTADPGAIYDVDFADTGGSNLNNVQYAVYSAAAQGGAQLKAWTDITTGINGANYTTNWGVDWASLQTGTNYVSARAYDNAGNVSAVSQDVFYIMKDTSVPTVTDNQAGDDTTYTASPGAIYDVDFADTGGSNLNNAQYAVYSAAALGGAQLKNWTDIATGINAANYTTNWGVDWASLQNGTNYVSVRAYDNAGNVSAVSQDVFYVKKDGAVPTVTDNQTGDDTVRTADPGAIYDVDFADTGGSNLNNAQYAVYSTAALGGAQLKAWTDIAAGINAANHTTNWGVDWASLQNGTNYVSVRAYDNAGNVSAVSQDVFYVKKSAGDITPPVQSAWSPAGGSTIANTQRMITLTLNENGDCRWSLADESYAVMATIAPGRGDCSGDGSTSIVCNVSGLTDGARTVSIACQDTSNNADTAGTNTDLNYTIDTSAPDTAPPVQSAHNPANGSTLASTTQVITLTLNEPGRCEWGFTDEVYSGMTGDICAGIYVTSITCTITGLVEGVNNVYITCMDSGFNFDTVDSDTDLTYTVNLPAADTTPPAQSAWNPAGGATITTASKNITLTLNETGDCKWSLTDQAYGTMAGDCTGGGTTSITCAVTGLTDGARTVSIACKDSLNNEDTAGTNTDLSYTVNTALPDTTPPVQSAWNPANGSTITTTTNNITLTLDETGDCKWSLSDQTYAAMSNACAGGGTTSITCAVTGLTDGARTVSIACKDSLNNTDTTGSNTDLGYTVNTGGGGVPAPETTPPMQTAHNPAAGATVKTSTPVITFTTNENADCKWSLTDQAYSAMTGDCAGDGTTSQTCAATGLTEGAVSIYLACRDAAGNADTAASNTGLSFTYQKASYDTGLQYQFIYLCPPITAAEAAQLGTVRRLVNGQYKTVDPTQAGPCDGYVTSTNAPVAFKADVPTVSQTHAITVGWNLIFNPFDAPLEYNGTHFSFTKNGEAVAVSLEDCVYLSDYAVLGPGHGAKKVVPDDVAAIPALSAFMIYSKADGELTIAP